MLRGLIHSMAIKRRDLLTLFALAPFADNTKAESSTTIAPSADVKSSTAVDSISSQKVAYVAAAKSRLGECSVLCLDHQGEVLTEHSIASRGHSFALSSDGHIAAIARRPADFCLILNENGKKISQFESIDNRHFYGHGVYDTDGDFLYLTENDYEAQGTRGMIGVYDVRNAYQRVGEYESGGIGPHQISLSADGVTLIVANGGIETHPESGRKKHNVASMKPSVSFIDRKTGSLMSNVELAPEYSTNSIRHMAVSSNGSVYVALQQQSANVRSCLLASVPVQTKSLTKIPLPVEYEQLLAGYVGDICLDSSEQYLAFSSPYGNCVVILDLSSSDFKVTKIDDVCGLTSGGGVGEFVASSGDGNLYLIAAGMPGANISVQKIQSHTVSWDNHIKFIT